MRNALLFLILLVPASPGQEPLPLVAVEYQPFAAQVQRLTEALELTGDPLPAAEAQALRQSRDVEAMQKILDRHCLVEVNLNPESRVKVREGPAKPELVQQGWRTFLIKVHNEAGITPVLAVESRNAGRLAGTDEPAVERKFLDMQMFNRQPTEAVPVRSRRGVPDSATVLARRRASAKPSSASTSAREHRTWGSAATWTFCSPASRPPRSRSGCWTLTASPPPLRF